MHGDRPVASAVGVGRQLAASRFREAQLNAIGFMHPVVGRELRAEGGKRVGARGIVAVISPGDGLHVRAKVTIPVAVDVNAQEFAIRTSVESVSVLGVGFASPHHSRSHIGNRLQSLVLDT